MTSFSSSNTCQCLTFNLRISHFSRCQGSTYVGDRIQITRYLFLQQDPSWSYWTGIHYKNSKTMQSKAHQNRFIRKCLFQLLKRLNLLFIPCQPNILPCQPPKGFNQLGLIGYELRHIPTDSQKRSQFCNIDRWWSLLNFLSFAGIWLNTFG